MPHRPITPSLGARAALSFTIGNV
eukprot:SAG31_NODE_21584_length_546_cov_0.619687_1_plen_23_part_10